MGHIQWLTRWANNNHATAAISLLGKQSSDHNSLVEERHDDFVPPENDPILQQTMTVVVKAVMELSNKVPLSQPNDYVEFVKVREGVGREEEERNQIHRCLLMSDMFTCLCRMLVPL